MRGTIKERRERNRHSVARLRERERDGRVLVWVEVPAHALRALERLGLLQPGERDKAAIAWAVAWFLETLPGFVAMGDAVWPERLWAEAGAGEAGSNNGAKLVP